MKKKVFSILLLIVVAFALTGCASDNSNLPDNNNSSVAPADDNLYSLGETFEFDGLELTFDTTYSFVSVDNSFSDYDGEPVIKLGVNVKNISEEKHHLNMFYYEIFGSKGTELNDISALFDDCVDFAGDLKPDSSYKTYFYILYDGDGKYSIDFDNYSQEVSVEFDVTK